MLILITPQNYTLHRDDLTALYTLRTKIHQTKQPENRMMQRAGIEKDEYDERNVYYLLYKDDKGNLKGGLRFIEMIYPCLLDAPSYAALSTVHDFKDFKRPNYWEVSRIYVDDESPQHHPSQTIILSLLVGYTLFGRAFECDCSLLIASPEALTHYQRYGFILAPLSDTSLHLENHHEPISVALYTPLHYCYDKLIQQTPINPYSLDEYRLV